MEIKNVIKAIIIRDNQLLVIKNLEEVYLLPETVQEEQETMAKSIEKECIEKFGILIDVIDVVYIKEEIDESYDSLSHRIEYYFACSIIDEINQEENQKDLYWIDIEKIMDYHICPLDLRQYIANYYHHKNDQVYLGKLEE